MAGHSKWAQIKHKKASTDQRRGVLFSKLLNAISIAARQEPNPEFNPRLRTAIEKAKESQVPRENIERAIKKATEIESLEEILIEAYGPEKTAIIIEGITNNKNRSINEIRTLLNENDAKMANQGSVLWLFEKKDNEWQPKFKQSVSEEGKKNLNALIEKIEEHGDIQRIITNTQ
jgi:YebC/PmpR family DNA-binding regulatory protein